MSEQLARNADPVAALRAEFPALADTGGPRRVLLDNASTTQKPRPVLDAIESYWQGGAGNVRRAGDALGRRATALQQESRREVQRFLNAADEREIVFTRGTTEAINLVAAGVAGSLVGEGDEVVVTALEHHSNLVPWQLLCQKVGARLRIAPLDERGDLDLDGLRATLSSRTRLVACAWVSNALGTILPVAEVTALARAAGAWTVVDAAQAVAHVPVDVQALGADFVAFSGHKVYGPDGIGVLYGRFARLASLPPYQGGGDMIQSVRYESASFDDPPHRFEAGTPNVGGAIGLAAALRFLARGGLQEIGAHERRLVGLLQRRLAELPRVRLVGAPRRRAAIVAFLVAGHDAHEVAAFLDEQGVSVRSGHLCAQPLLQRLGHDAVVRASVALYNTSQDVEAMIQALARIAG
jgi:cysteine desulfurase/selenocysteine lyase